MMFGGKVGEEVQALVQPSLEKLRLVKELNTPVHGRYSALEYNEHGEVTRVILSVRDIGTILSFSVSREMTPFLPSTLLGGTPRMDFTGLTAAKDIGDDKRRWPVHDDLRRQMKIEEIRDRRRSESGCKDPECPVHGRRH